MGVGREEIIVKTTVIAAAVLLPAASASAQSVAEKTGANSLIGIVPTTQHFILQTAASDMFGDRMRC